MDLTAKTYEEIVYKNKIEELLAHPELLSSWVDMNGVERYDKQDLIKILGATKNNKLKVCYTHSKKSKKKFGRVYPKNRISLGALGRKLRGTLTNGTYIDIDIKNCHPVLILHFLKKFGFPHKHYAKYVNDRQLYLDKIKKVYNCTRDEAKQFFISAGYGGGYNSWINGLGDHCNHQGSEQPLWILFQNEAKLVADKFIDTNPERYNDWKNNRDKTYNHDFGFLAIMLQNIEREILETMTEFFITEGLIRNNNVILCHDGLMLKIKSIRVDTLKGVEQAIFNKHGFIVSVVDKPLEHLCNELKQEKIIAEGEPMDMQYLINLKTYKLKKEYFERYVCKIIKTGEFIELSINIDERGFKNYTHTTKKETVLVQSYKHFLSHKLFNADEVALKKQAPKSFITKWLCDPEMRTYMDQDWIPYNGVYKQTDKKIYNLFTGYSSVITSPVPDNYLKYVKPFLEILLNLCEGEQRNLDFLLHYLAHIIQKPAEKMRFCIIFTGSQGTGKDTILVAMSKIFGTDMVQSESNPENLIGKHATAIVKKLLVAFNESEARKTFDFEGIMKSLITEPTLIVNPKNMQPYSIKNVARPFINSNKDNPIKFDAVSKDRRFIAWKSTDTFSNPKYGNFWKQFYKLIDTSKFASSLYHYLNTIDISSYDFAKERLGVLTETYRDMCMKQLPPLVDFMVEHVNKFSNKHFWDIEQKDDEGHIWEDYKRWQARNRPDSLKDSGYIGTKSNFKSSFKTLNIPLKFFKTNSNMKTVYKYKFIPCVVYGYLCDRGWVGDSFLPEESEESDLGLELFDF